MTDNVGLSEKDIQILKDLIKREKDIRRVLDIFSDDTPKSNRFPWLQELDPRYPEIILTEDKDKL